MRLPLLVLGLFAGHAGFAAAAPVAPAPVPVQDYVRLDSIGLMSLSPDGSYLATTIKTRERVALTVMRRSNGEQLSGFNPEQWRGVQDVNWVTPERLLFSYLSTNRVVGGEASIGEIYAMNAAGAAADPLILLSSPAVATRVKARKPELATASFIDRGVDDATALVAIHPVGRDLPMRAERITVDTGRGRVVARPPTLIASFTADHEGQVRFSQGYNHDKVSKLYYRVDDSAEWQLINDEAKSGLVQKVLGFSADGATAYLRTEQPGRPDVVVGWDVAGGQRRTLLQGEVDPWKVLYLPGRKRVPVGVMLMGDKPSTTFFDENSDVARLYRSLEAAFPGEAVHLASYTDDGSVVVAEVFSERNPGDYYLYDTRSKRAEHLGSKRGWIDPDMSAPMRRHSLTAADGTKLHAFVTRPQGAGSGALPMVVMPHPTAYASSVSWTYQPLVQMFARAGYAVLQLDHRGSPNHGRDFREAGAGQWGQAMQDDMTVATRWAVSEGIADAGRICIYGQGYGGYVAMMEAAREPQLYRCAVGDSGTYDPAKLHREMSASPYSKSEANEWMGDPAILARQSALHAADRIKSPVLLVAFADRDSPPAEQARAMESAIKRAGGNLETRIDSRTTMKDEHLAEHYTLLLDFLSRHLGGAKAAKPDAVAGAGK